MELHAFDRGWVKPVLVILIVLLAVETAFLFLFFVESIITGSQTFPGLTVRNVLPGCSTLTSTTQYSTIANRTLLFNCPGAGTDSYALRTNRGGIFSNWSKSLYYSIFRTTPTFTLPPGYLALWLTTGDCTKAPSNILIQLESGHEIVLGGFTTSFDYCATLDKNFTRTPSFTIDWSPGTAPQARPAPFTITASPTDTTISRGGTGTFVVTVTSLGGWRGDVNVTVGAGYTLGVGGWQTSPPTIHVEPGGSNLTVLSLPTCENNGTICAFAGSYPDVRFDAYTGCLYRVQGICFDYYNDAYASVKVTIV